MTNLESLKELLKRIHLLIGTPAEQAQRILAVGQLLCQGKVAHKGQRGQFGKFVGEIPLTMRMAQHYMTVANNPHLANAKYLSHLPPTLTALLALDRVPTCQLELALMDRLVHPQLTEDEVKALFAPTPAALSDTTWSPDDAVARIHNAYALAFNAELDRAPVDGRDELIAAAIDALPQLADHHEAARDPDLRAAVDIARDGLSVRDAEPGGRRYFDSDGQCIGGCKSTYSDEYKTLTTKQEGVTPLTRKQVEARLDDIEQGILPTKRTAQTHFAVMWAIKDLPRTSS